jgi:bifunctional DNA-binding transcriptional regulator/antitoxin component of YhaV-PrlF toxin-antitoxin module
VTAKLQVTVPKAIADQYRIKPGDDIHWLAAGESIRVVPAKTAARQASNTSRLQLFDAATRRQAARNRGVPAATGARGWTRDELYDRDRSR